MDGQMTFEFAQRPTIKGFPELRWTGKRPYRSTQYFPAQLRERYGEEKDGWINKIFWGDNLQVMSHMLKEYRGKIDLIYIDPPFDSKADYKKKIEVKGIGKAETDSTSFEEKQYGDIASFYKHHFSSVSSIFSSIEVLYHNILRCFARKLAI